jgi:hypothetical protein
VFYGSSHEPTLKYDFSDYLTVNGIQMPGKLKKGRINFQINPDFDMDIFTRPPSVEPDQRPGKDWLNRVRYRPRSLVSCTWGFVL